MLSLAVIGTFFGTDQIREATKPGSVTFLVSVTIGAVDGAPFTYSGYALVTRPGYRQQNKY